MRVNHPDPDLTGVVVDGVQYDRDPVSGEYDVPDAVGIGLLALGYTQVLPSEDDPAPVAVKRRRRVAADDAPAGD